MTFIDLSHPIAHGTVTYPGLPALSITDYLSREASKARYAGGTTFQIARIEMVANTGTYLDAPCHRYENGADFSSLPLETMADLEGIAIDATTAGRAIGPALFHGIGLKKRAVLVHTGWSRHFGTNAYAANHPFLTADAAQALIDAGAALVGIDSMNIDDSSDGTRPVHSMLLAANILIVEHMTNLAALPRAGTFRFFAVPPAIRGVGSFPVRAFAIT
jgi:kynurenine formamidase